MEGRGKTHVLMDVLGSEGEHMKHRSDSPCCQEESTSINDESGLSGPGTECDVPDSEVDEAVGQQVEAEAEEATEYIVSQLNLNVEAASAQNGGNREDIVAVDNKTAATTTDAEEVASTDGMQFQSGDAAIVGHTATSSDDQAGQTELQHSAGITDGHRDRTRSSFGSSRTKEEPPAARQRLKQPLLHHELQVGIVECREFRVVRRLIGPGGENMKFIASECPGTKLELRGAGANPWIGSESGPLVLHVRGRDPVKFAAARELAAQLLEQVKEEHQQFLSEGRRRPE